MTSVDPDTILTIDGGWKNVYGQKNFNVPLNERNIKFV
jgi:hypothetical protein